MHAPGLRLASSSALAGAKRPCRTSWAPRRRLHTRKELPYKIDDGLGNFMSPQTLRMVAVEYQQGLLDRLNAECRDVEDKRKTVAQLVLDTARSQSRTVMFKYASHALNNSFFLHCLRPPTPSEHRVEESSLGPAIQRQFGGLDALRSLFSAAVNGMAGSGYVWFVTDARKNLALVPTFASGTLLIRSSVGTVEPVTAPVLGEGSPLVQPPQRTESRRGASRVTHGVSQLDPLSPARTFHTSVASRIDYATRASSIYDPTVPSHSPHGSQDSHDINTLGEYIYPLFCISVHEHCWLLDHGIWGKEKYLEEFWRVVDWNQVVERFETFTKVAI